MAVSKRLWLALLAALALGGACAADIPPPPGHPRARRPRPPQGAEAVLQIIPSPTGDQARLVIPRAALSGLKTGAAGSEPDSSAGMAGVQTVVAGTALSLAMAFAGLWLARKRRRLSAGIAAMVVCAAGGAGITATRALANAAPSFAQPKSDANPAAIPSGGSRINVRLVVVDGGDAIKLYLPASANADKSGAKQSQQSAGPGAARSRTGAAKK